MAGRLSAQPGFRRKSVKVERTRNLKRKAWLALFAGSALFWLFVTYLIWRIWG